MRLSSHAYLPIHARLPAHAAGWADFTKWRTISNDGMRGFPVRLRRGDTLDFQNLSDGYARGGQNLEMDDVTIGPP